jgi:hypothetical protein
MQRKVMDVSLAKSWGMDRWHMPLKDGIAKTYAFYPQDLAARAAWGGAVS